MPIELSTLFMQRAHRSIGQTRKDNVRPYEIHPTGVRRRTAQVTCDPHVLAAADLHDVEEDVAPKHSFIPVELYSTFNLFDRPHGWKYDLETIDYVFGKRVFEYVRQLTDVYTKEAFPELNRKKRKQAERERYSTFDTEVKWIKLADIGENLADDGEVLLADGGPEVGFNQMFIWEKSLCLPYLCADDPENKLLFGQAMEILHEQAKKFAVRL